MQNISPTLFDHVSHTIFDEKIHDPSFAIKDNCLTNSK